MGLFDDLPSAKRPAPEPAPEPEPAPAPEAKRAKASDGPETRPREVDHGAALAKIAAHIGNPAKFKKCAQLALALMRGGELERRHGKALFAVLTNAMEPTPRRANDPAVRFEYRELFDAAEACGDDGVLNAKHKAQLAVWMLHVRVVNDVHTDDNFQFAKATKAVKALVDALDDLGPRPHDDEDDENDEKKDDDEKANEGEDDEAREMREYAQRMRAAERRAELDAWQLREDEREALLDACDAAHSLYKFAWAQTGVDMLVEHVHERRARFGETHRRRIVEMYEAVRDKRNKRRKGGGGGEGMSSFEQSQARYSGAAISIRGGVGGEGTRDGRGESAVGGF
jgi:hypothetical protein